MMMACGRTVGDESWCGEAKACILKRKHITFLIQFLAYIRQIHFSIGRISTCKHRTRVIFAKLNFTNDNESTRRLALATDPEAKAIAVENTSRSIFLVKNYLSLTNTENAT